MLCLGLQRFSNCEHDFNWNKKVTQSHNKLTFLSVPKLRNKTQNEQSRLSHFRLRMAELSFLCAHVIRPCLSFHQELVPLHKSPLRRSFFLFHILNFSLPCFCVGSYFNLNFIRTQNFSTPCFTPTGLPLPWSVQYKNPRHKNGFCIIRSTWWQPSIVHLENKRNNFN